MGRKKFLFMFLCILAVVFGCNSQSSVDPAMLRVPVGVEIVGKGEIAAYVTQTGTLLPEEEMNIVSEINGDIHFIMSNSEPIKRGDFVKDGQVLAQLTNEEYELNIALPLKELTLTHAKRDLENVKSLSEKGGTTQREVENAERTLANAENSYKSALLSLAKMKIKAPISGIITDLGTFVEGQRINSGTQIGKIMRYDKVRCELNLTSEDYRKVRIGQEAVVTDISQSSTKFQGVVSKVNPTIDPTTRTVKVEIGINNPDFRLKPGAYVKVDIIVERHTNIIKIPKRAIMTRNNRDVVFIVTEDQIAKEKPVTVGLKDTEYAEIIDGLNENERLVIRGFETLQTNTKVRISQ